MSFGFPAYHESSKAYNVEAYELRKMIETVLAEFGWRLEIDTISNITALVPISGSSWGEKLIISFGENGVLNVRSEGLLPMQCIDWGKNRRNVVRFLDRLSMLERSAHNKTAP